MNNDNENTEVLYSVPGETEPIQVDSNLVEDFLKDYPDATLVNQEGDSPEVSVENGPNSIVNNIPELIRNPNDGTITQRPLGEEAGSAENLDEFVQSTITENIDQNEFLTDGKTPNPNFGLPKLHLEESEAEKFVLDELGEYELDYASKDELENNIGLIFDRKREEAHARSIENERLNNVDNLIKRPIYTQISDHNLGTIHESYEYRPSGS